METHPIIDETHEHAVAFEIETVYVSPGTIARLLAPIDGVTDVQTRRMFGQSSDIHVEFKYRSRDHVVWEPYGDSSRYWIGPKNPMECTNEIERIEKAFKDYSPPFYRRILGGILSLKLTRRPQKQ